MAKASEKPETVKEVSRVQGPGFDYGVGDLMMGVDPRSPAAHVTHLRFVGMGEDWQLLPKGKRVELEVGGNGRVSGIRLV